jgi:hypothetical protein
MTLRHSYFESTSNFFYFNPRRETYHVLTSSGEVASILPFNEYNGKIVSVYFILDDRTEIFSRSYNTFFDILGSVGGIYSFLTFVVGLIVTPIT